MKPETKLKRNAVGLIIALTIQYFLGIITNLYATFPENGTPSDNWKFAHTQVGLMAHVILGALLVVGSIALIVRAYLSGDKTWKIVAGIGFASILFAGLAGSEFVSTQNDKYSLAMAIFFITALVSYGWGLIKTKG